MQDASDQIGATDKRTFGALELEFFTGEQSFGKCIVFALSGRIQFKDDFDNSPFSQESVVSKKSDNIKSAVMTRQVFAEVMCARTSRTEAVYARYVPGQADIPRDVLTRDASLPGFFATRFFGRVGELFLELRRRQVAAENMRPLILAYIKDHYLRVAVERGEDFDTDLDVRAQLIADEWFLPYIDEASRPNGKRCFEEMVFSVLCGDDGALKLHAITGINAMLLFHQQRNRPHLVDDCRALLDITNEKCRLYNAEISDSIHAILERVEMFRYIARTCYDHHCCTPLVLTDDFLGQLEVPATEPVGNAIYTRWLQATVFTIGNAQSSLNGLLSVTANCAEDNALGCLFEGGHPSVDLEGLQLLQSHRDATSVRVRWCATNRSDADPNRQPSVKGRPQPRVLRNMPLCSLCGLMFGSRLLNAVRATVTRARAAPSSSPAANVAAAGPVNS
eukprot:c17679_g1_i3.p1 GENE.c17679_g1_i3~~c17679_g1_i3.p1  ORF type:complete len:449 (-),score=40.39 c17679_g1_i3:583-1929(-)